MEIMIVGAGSSNRQEVSDGGQALTLSEAHSVQMHHSRKRGQAFQVEGFHTITSAGTKTILTVKNKLPASIIGITYIRAQVVGLTTAGTAMPAKATRFEYGNGNQRASSGNAVVAKNLNSKSGNTAIIEAYGDNPTMENTFDRFDTWWVKGNGEEQVWKKEGSIIFGMNDSFTIQLITDFTNGDVRARISFVVLPITAIRSALS